MDDDEKEASVNKLKGDQEIVESAAFARQIQHPALTEEEKEKITSIKITNFPLEIEVKDLLNFRYY